MRTTKAQISPRIHTVWSGLHCPLTDTMYTTKCKNREQRPRWYFAHAKDDLNLYILRMLEGSFLITPAHVKAAKRNLAESSSE